MQAFVHFIRLVFQYTTKWQSPRFVLAGIMLFVALKPLLAFDYYTSQEIPIFTEEERTLFDRYELQFKPMNWHFSVNKHNNEVLGLIKKFGAQWKSEIIFDLGGDRTKPIIKFLHGLGGKHVVNLSKKKHMVFFHYKNGLISSRAVVDDSKSRGIMIDRTTTTTIWDKTGKKKDTSTSYIQGNGCCFAGSTLVTMADGSLKPIKEVQTGDRIQSYDEETNTLMPATVQKTIAVKHQNIVKLNFEGFTIELTPDHPLLDAKGMWKTWDMAKSAITFPQLELHPLKIGDEITFVGANGVTKAKLISIEKLNKVQTMYVINKLDHGNTFIVNGAITTTEPLTEDLWETIQPQL